MVRHGQMVHVAKPAQCRKCGADISFFKSEKTQRWYPTDVMVADGELVTGKTWFHKCRTTPTQEV